MADHRVSIGSLRTDATAVATAAEVAPLRGRLDRALGDHLPRLLATACGPVLDGHDGVLRLRRLLVTLDHTGPFDEATIARLLAERVASALRDELAAPGEASRTWPDPESYLAAYVETLLGLDSVPRWAFSEFSALEVLSPAEAAVTVLTSRPAVLSRLARNGAGAGNPARLTDRLDDTMCARLLDGLLDTGGGVLAEDVTAVSAGERAAPPAPADVPRAALDAALRTLARRPTANPGRAVRAAAVTSALAALPIELGLAVTAEPPTAALPADLTAAFPAPARRAAMLLREALADRTVRVALGALTTGAREPRAHTGRDATAGGRIRSRRSEDRRSTLFSPVAGLVLLLPGTARLALHRALSPAQLRGVALSALGADARHAATDRVVGALFPSDPTAEAGPVPPVPGQVLQSLPDASRDRVASSDPTTRWGEVLVAEFALRLPGLGRSSADYLRRQFFYCPGSLEMSDDEVTVALDGPPLAVVLAMAGLHGDQGPLPHLEGRRLTILLPRLRR